MRPPPWVVDDRGRVTGFKLPDGSIATNDDLIEESKVYAGCLCQDSRMMHVHAHTHNCTFTCVKNQKGALNSSESLKLQKAPLCRFHYYRVMKVPVKTDEGGFKERLVRRRGKALVHKNRVGGKQSCWCC